MKKFALLGHDIGYSRSPAIHAAVYRAFGLDATYELIDVAPEDLAAAVARLRAEFAGFNITKPYKLAILPFLDCAHADTVNTVVVRDGSLTGYNTDGYGFERDFSGTFDCNGKTVLVLGAGGVAKIIVPTLVNLGARVFIHNRTRSRAEETAAAFGANVYADERPQIIVNCTSVGLRVGENPLPDTVELTKLEGAYDTIYAPPETDFLRTCRLRGAKTKNGLGMLVWQALKADEYMCDIQCDDMLAKKIINELESTFIA